MSSLTAEIVHRNQRLDLLQRSNLRSRKMAEESQQSRDDSLRWTEIIAGIVSRKRGNVCLEGVPDVATAQRMQWNNTMPIQSRQVRLATNLFPQLESLELTEQSAMAIV